jgi:RNA polymerase sigma factor (sigma-70 family)
VRASELPGGRHGVDPPNLEELALQLYRNPENKVIPVQIRHQIRSLLCSRAGMCGAAPGDEEQVADRVLDKVIKKICCGEYEAARSDVATYAMGFTDFTVKEFYRDRPRTVPLLPEHEDLIPAPVPKTEPAQSDEDFSVEMTQAIEMLSPSNRKLLVDLNVNLKTYEEIAQEQDKTVEAVRQHAWRARKDLKTKIELDQQGRVRLKADPAVGN